MPQVPIDSTLVGLKRKAESSVTEWCASEKRGCNPCCENPASNAVYLLGDDMRDRGGTHKKTREVLRSVEQLYDS